MNFSTAKCTRAEYVSFINAVLGEDFANFQVAVPVPMGAVSGQMICVISALLEILDDDIVESDQSFSLNFAGSTIGATVFDNSSLDVVIMDDSDG